MVELSLESHRRPWHRLDPGWAGGHHRWQCRFASDRTGSGLSLSVSGVGTAAAIYVAGACIGALFFGQLCDRFGRKKLFMITLGVYIVSTTVTAFSFAPWFFYLARFFTGAGIGGEYAAINSAIDELIPARVRGRVDLIINGPTGSARRRASAAALVFLDTAIFPMDLGWRLAFGLGAVLGLVITLVRRKVPGEPAVAVHPWPRGGGRADRRRGRARRRAGDWPEALGSVESIRSASARRSRSGRSLGWRSRLSQAHGPGPLAVRRPSVPLQRRDLQPRHADDDVLRLSAASCRCSS